MPKHRSVLVLMFASLFAIGSPAVAAEKVPDILRRQTQELVDAIAAGRAAVWDRYLDEGVRYVDENGKVLTKKEMVEGTKPLAEGVSGTIRVTDFDTAVHGDVAVATYVDDENEDFHGYKLHCQYRTTDTWLKTAEGWRLIAAQVLAMRADPPGVPLAASLRAEYCGRYALTPEIAYEIRCNGDGLEGQQSGRKAEELRAEESTKLAKRSSVSLSDRPMAAITLNVNGEDLPKPSTGASVHSCRITRGTRVGPSP